MQSRFFLKINKLTLFLYSYLIFLLRRLNSWNSKIDVLFIPQIGGDGGAKYYFFRAIEFYGQSKINVVVLLNKAIADKEIELFLRKNKIHYEIYSLEKSIVNNSQLYLFSNEFEKTVCRYAGRYKPKIVVAAVTEFKSAFSLFLLPYRLIFICLTNPVFVKINNETKYYLRRFFNNDVLLVCGSEYSRKYIAEEWLKDSAPKNLIDFQNCISDTSNGKRVYDRKNDKAELIVLTVATVEKWKEPDLWINIAQKVLDEDINVRFRWVGSGSMIEDCRKKIAEIGESKIDIAGYVDDIDSEFLNADIYLHTAINDMTSYSVMQAMSFGLPVVCHNGQSMVEMIENEIEGFSVNVSDTNKAANKVLLLLKDDSLRKRMGMAARKRFEKLFSITNWHENMRLIHKVI